MASPFHPDLATLARWLPRGVARRWSLPFLRGLARVTARRGSGEEIALGGCRVIVYRPAGDAPSPRPAVLWIHGGGLLFGDARQDAAFVQRLVDELGVVAAAVQYRLAPEHPFPVPLEDCYQAFRWLAEQPEVDAGRIAVAGASAGGGLAAALCQLCRARGGVQPSFQLLVYPMLDDRSSARDDFDDRPLRVWDRHSNALGWAGYLKGHDRQAPPAYSVPARTEDLFGLPPAWIGVGSLDLFHEEDLTYARRLREAGVPVEVQEVEGAYHGFDAADARAPVSRAFREAQVSALGRRLWILEPGARPGA